jgi:hypothetical protein
MRLLSRLRRATATANYVQAQDSPVWHWCHNCSQYPKRLANSQSRRPVWRLCDECREKEEGGDCRG